MSGKRNGIHFLALIYILEEGIAPEIPGLNNCFTQADRHNWYKSILNNPSLLEDIGKSYKYNVFSWPLCASNAEHILASEALPVSAEHEHSSDLWLSFMLASTKQLDSEDLLLVVKGLNNKRFFALPTFAGEGFSVIRENYSLSHPIFLSFSESDSDSDGV